MGRRIGVSVVLEKWVVLGETIQTVKEVANQCTKRLGRIPPASDCHNIRLAARGPPHTGWRISTRPGLHRVLGIWNDAQRGLKEGSLAAITLAVCDANKGPNEKCKIVLG